MAIFKTLIPFIQIVVAILLIGAILFQQRGVGLGSAFGGEGGIYRTKRGLEKILFISTIILGALFVLLAILGLF